MFVIIIIIRRRTDEPVAVWFLIRTLLSFIIFLFIANMFVASH